MFRKTLLLSLCIVAAVFFNFACQSAETTNSNTAVVVNSANAKSQTNVPPEFSGSPITVNANAPGFPAAIANSFNANVPRGTTPTPGIPSQEVLRKQMNTPLGNSKLMDRKPPVVESNVNSSSPTDRPRVVRKP